MYISEYIINPPKNVNDFEKDLDINKVNETAYIKKEYDNKLTNEEINNILKPYLHPVIVEEIIEERIRCIKQIIVGIQKKEDNPTNWIFNIITTCNNLESVPLKKVLLIYWEVIFNIYNSREYPELKDMIVLIINSLKKDMHHPNEYLRGRFTRLVGKLKDADLLVELVPTIINNTMTSFSYVNNCAIGCLVEISALEDINIFLKGYYDVINSEMRRNTDNLLIRDSILLLFSLDLDKSIEGILKDKLFLSQLGEVEQTAILSVLKHYRLLEYHDLLAHLLDIMGNLKSSVMINYDIVSLLTDQALNKVTMRTICTGYCKILKKMSDYDARNIILDQINQMVERVGNLPGKNKYLLLKLLKEFIQEFINCVEQPNMFGSEPVSEGAVFIYGKMLKIITSNLLDNYNYNYYLQCIEEKLHTTSKDNHLVRRCLYENILYIYSNFDIDSVSIKTYNLYRDTLIQDYQITYDTFNSNINHLISNILFTIIPKIDLDLNELIRLNTYFNHITVVKNYIFTNLSPAVLGDMCYEWNYSSLFIIFENAYNYYKSIQETDQPTKPFNYNAKNINCWNKRLLDILTGSDYKTILSEQEQKKNDLIPICEYFIDNIHTHIESDKKKLNKNIVIFTKMLYVLNKLSLKQKQNYYLFESVKYKTEYLLKISLSMSKAGKIEKMNNITNKFVAGNHLKSDSVKKLQAVKFDFETSTNSIYDPINFEIFESHKLYEEYEHNDFKPISLPMPISNLEDPKSSKIDKLLSVKQLTSPSDMAFVEAQFWLQANKEILLEFTVINTSNRILENANLDVSASSLQIEISKVKRNIINLSPGKKMVDIYVINVSEYQQTCVLSGSVNFVVKQKYYTYNLDNYEIDIFDKLKGFHIEKDKFKSLYKECAYRENLSAQVLSENTAMVRKEIELLGFSFLKETDDYSFKNIIDEIHYMAGESVFGQKVYMTMQYKVQDKKYGRYDFSLSCNDKNSILAIKEKIIHITNQINITMQRKRD